MWRTGSRQSWIRTGLLWAWACMVSITGDAALAQTATARVALVIGNGAYADSPLPNPPRDARAMAELLRRAGFDVDLLVDAPRLRMQQALQAFGQRLRTSPVQLAVFYYAGHGFQLDWRNHLVPVDARVRSAAEVAAQTVDVGDLIRQFQAAGTAKGRSQLVILDACRDDPFAGRYRPPAPGLLPFDAPTGSLLAYATGPGRVALDGAEGGNGLYTKHLLRELAVPDASVEDALKRVRLAVRVESRGRQVPWEMASLEDSVYLFDAPRAPASERELQRRFDDELQAWNRVRLSGSSAALTEFLRAYPSGNASELAQARLNRLLADELRRAAESPAVAGPPAAPPAVQVSPPAAVSTPAGPASVAVAVAPQPAPRPAPPVSVAPAASVTPAPVVALAPAPGFSGQNEHWRDFRVGQRLEFRVVDGYTRQEKPLVWRVTRVDAAADRVEINDGELLSDLMGNTLANPRGAMSTPRQFYPAEFSVGKRWKTEFQQARPSGLVYTFRYQLKVAARESITVPAGRFDAWRIEAEGFNVGLGAYIRRTLWVAPGVPGDVASETFVRLRNGVVEQNDRQELVAVHAPG
ncbi:MAG: caspase family protein [Rubrivivax sp.]